MKNRIFYGIIFFVTLFNGQIFAQTQNTGFQVPYESCINCTTSDYEYSGTIDFFTTRNIISDFGPRYLNSSTPYDFHGGIDFTITEPFISPPNDLGFHVIAIDAGTIIRLENYNNGSLKYLVIDGEGTNDFGYLHLFDDTTLPTQIGDMKYVEINDTFPNEITYGILDITNNTLFSDCQRGNCDSTFFYVYNQDTIFATNQISQANVRIAILGTSGNVGSHLHLNRYANSDETTDFVNDDIHAVDPLESIAHQGPDYDIKILYNTTTSNIDSYPEGISIKYPGSTSTSVLIRPIMPDVNEDGNINNGILSGSNRIFLNNTLNIHAVELFLTKNNFQDSFLIKGSYFESKFHLGTKIEENTKYPSHIITRSSTSKGSWMRTGIHPLAYKTNSPRRWDDFYFADFITRIHKDDPMDGTTTPTLIAHCPQDARYNDGRYQLKAVVKDVRYDSTATDAADHIFEGPRNDDDELDPIAFVLDNFKPFLQRVKVSFDDKVVYDMSWGCEDNCTGMRAVQEDVSKEELNQNNLENKMIIAATTSESLTAVLS